MSLNEVISSDALCLTSSNKLSSFSKDGGVERVSFFSGKAEAIQAGGYNTSQEFGLDLKSCLFGTNGSFGIPYEVVLNLDSLKEKN